MSRIGREPLSVPDGVDVAVDGDQVSVSGPKGALEQHVPEGITVSVSDGVVEVDRDSDLGPQKAAHGMVRSIVGNMVHGVSQGYSRTLEIVGVGYRASGRPGGVTVQAGYSHNVEFDAPPGVEISVPSASQIVVNGVDKQQVGQVAADIRAIRPPEPYKGKGIRYADERVRRKVGKAGR